MRSWLAWALAYTGCPRRRRRFTRLVQPALVVSTALEDEIITNREERVANKARIGAAKVAAKSLSSHKFLKKTRQQSAEPQEAKGTSAQRGPGPARPTGSDASSDSPYSSSKTGSAPLLSAGETNEDATTTHPSTLQIVPEDCLPRVVEYLTISDLCHVDTTRRTSLSGQPLVRRYWRETALEVLPELETLQSRRTYVADVSNKSGKCCICLEEHVNSVLAKPCNSMRCSYLLCPDCHEEHSSTDSDWPCCPCCTLPYRVIIFDRRTFSGGVILLCR